MSSDAISGYPCLPDAASEAGRMTWVARAQEVVTALAATLPQQMTLAERRCALRKAYPFGQREGWSYRVWLCACRAYLAPFIGPDAPEACRLVARESKAGQLYLFTSEGAGK